MKYGFIPPVIDSTHYVLGSSPLGLEVLEPKGDWYSYLPPTERQAVNIETYNCTSFATLNALETLTNRLKQSQDFSDRFLGIAAGTTPPGNDPHRVIEAARHTGLVAEATLPFLTELENWQEYYSYKYGDQTRCLDEAANFLTRWQIAHEWVTPTDSEMRKALQSSPLGIAVSAWTEENGEYISTGPANHWTLLYKIDADGRKYVFDSYEPFYKVLRADHKIEYCKRYALTPLMEKITLQKKLISLLLTYVQLLKMALRTSVQTAGEIIGALYTRDEDRTPD
jgi:hypothetical protein